MWQSGRHAAHAKRGPSRARLHELDAEAHSPRGADAHDEVPAHPTGRDVAKSTLVGMLAEKVRKGEKFVRPERSVYALRTG